MAKLTIITAAYRKEGTLRVLKNLESQSNKNFEHILVSDGSQETTPEFLKEVCEGHPNRHWIYSSVNGGFYGAFARNCGAMYSFNYFAERVRKEDNDFWIYFMDDDNEITEDAIDLFFKARAENKDAVMIGADLWEIRGKIDKNYSHTLKNRVLGQQTDLGCWFYKKEVFDNVGYFPASDRFKITYDFELIRRIKEHYGEDKFYIVPDKKFFIFYHKQR